MNIFRRGKASYREFIFTTLHISFVLLSFVYSAVHLTLHKNTNLVENLITMSISVVTMSKVATFLFFADDFKILSNTIKEDLFLHTEGNEKYIKMQEMASKKSKYFSLTLITGMFITVIVLSLYPLLVWPEKKLPMATIGVLVPFDTTYAFIINYIFQSWYQFFCVIIASSHAAFFTLLLLQGCAHIDILRHKIESNRVKLTKNGSRLLYGKRLHSIHGHQIEIMKFV